MHEFSKWAPAEELAAAVELRQPGTLKILEDYMDHCSEWLVSEGRLGTLTVGPWSRRWATCLRT